MTDLFIPDHALEVEHQIYQFPYEQIRFVVNKDRFIEDLNRLNIELIEPAKEVVVQNRHTMGTFMLQKSS